MEHKGSLGGCCFESSNSFHSKSNREKEAEDTDGIYSTSEIKKTSQNF